MKQLLTFLFAFSLALTGMAADPSNESVFQIRLVVDHSSTNADEMVYERHNGKHEIKETIWVERKCLLDASAIESAEVESHQPSSENIPGVPETWHAAIDTNVQTSINFRLTKIGAKQLEAVTSENAGKRIAFFVGGKIRMVPMIGEPITTGDFMVHSSFTKDEADKIVSDIKAGLKK